MKTYAEVFICTSAETGFSLIQCPIHINRMHGECRVICKGNANAGGFSHARCPYWVFTMHAPFTTMKWYKGGVWDSPLSI